MTSRAIPNAAPGPERQRLAERYAHQRRLLWLLDQIAGGAYVVGWLALGLHVAVRSALPLAYPLQVAVMLAGLAGGYALLSLPIRYAAYRLARRYRISTQSHAAWAADLTKGLLVGAVIGLIAVEGLYTLIALSPTWWWLLASGAALLFTAVLTNLAPVVIVPLFYRLQPLDRPELVERLRVLAERAGSPVRAVCTIGLSAKGTAANAAVIGLGNTRRIVVSDTMLDRYADDEIVVVLAHELGHQVHRDLARLIIGQAVLTLVGFFLASRVVDWLGPLLGTAATDPASLPLLALVLGCWGLATMPLANAYSRRLERRADQFALELTGDPQAFISMMNRLTDQNLTVAQPAPWVKWLFYDHPTPAERIALANQYAHWPGSAA